jgi:hypothetical protein
MARGSEVTGVLTLFDCWDATVWASQLNHNRDSYRWGYRQCLQMNCSPCLRPHVISASVRGRSGTGFPIARLRS